jgi:hypothetical protein
MCNQLSRKPPEIPQDKDRAIQDSFDRIKSIEYDLEKTKKVFVEHVLQPYGAYSYFEVYGIELYSDLY